MGEYVNGIKLGTCENLYYVRFSDVQNMPGAEDYLAPMFRYRFPFPEEDGAPAGQYAPYDKGLLVNIASDHCPELLKEYRSEDWDHQDIVHSQSADGAYNVNVFVPCIASPDFPDNLRTSSRNAMAPIKIVFQRQIDGELWTIVSCGYCGAMVRLTRANALELAALLRSLENNTSDPNGNRRAYYNTVANRILAGYKDMVKRWTPGSSEPDYFGSVEEAAVFTR